MKTAAARRKIVRVLEILEREQGVEVWKGPRRDPLAGLIGAILSQATNDANRDRAYRSLIERFGGDWERIRRAPTRKVRDAIRGAGLANQKAPRIKAVLEWVRENFGGFDMSALCDMPECEVFETLGALKGVGTKSVAVTLMFSCGADLCAVDTHVNRIMGRLGVVGGKTPSDKTFAALRPLVPEGKAYSLHMNLIRFGRTVCRAQRPLCADCPLRRLCRYYRHVYLLEAEGGGRRG
jgi:endonuclease-3